MKLNRPVEEPGRRSLRTGSITVLSISMRDKEKIPRYFFTIRRAEKSDSEVSVLPPLVPLRYPIDFPTKTTSRSGHLPDIPGLDGIDEAWLLTFRHRANGAAEAVNGASERPGAFDQVGTDGRRFQHRPALPRLIWFGELTVFGRRDCPVPREPFGRRTGTRTWRVLGLPTRLRLFLPITGLKAERECSEEIELSWLSAPLPKTEGLQAERPRSGSAASPGVSSLAPQGQHGKRK